MLCFIIEIKNSKGTLSGNAKFSTNEIDDISRRSQLLFQIVAFILKHSEVECLLHSLQQTYSVQVVEVEVFGEIGIFLQLKRRELLVNFIV